ncbi:MAG: alpha/beta fold hydrolase [Candidatus Hermodarchaeota archaeon]
MPEFTNDGVKIYYEIEGKGPPVLLIHGFSSSMEYNWKQQGWLDALKDNFKVILIDCRGHGKSDKPHDKAFYGQRMQDDVVKLLEHLSIEKANLFGYSMGALITYSLLLRKPEIFISAILGGFVLTFREDEKARNDFREIIKRRIGAFKADTIEQVKDPMARQFREYAEMRGNDLLALAAVEGGTLEQFETAASPDQIKDSLKKIDVPVLTVVGSNEAIAGDKTLIAQLVPNACHFQIQGKDHLTVVSDPKFHMVVNAFLDYINIKKD